MLLDESHNNYFSPSEIESLLTDLSGLGARVEPVSSSFGSYGSRSLSDQLKYASAYITIAPQQPFSVDEVQSLTEFVDRGGHLLVIADPTRSDSSYSGGDVDAANSLLASFDLSFRGDYLYNMTDYEGNFRNVIFEKLADRALTLGLGRVVFYGVHSVQTTDGTPLLSASSGSVSSATDLGGALSAAAVDRNGNVLAIGDMTFLTPPYNQVADNPVLIRNIANFLAGASRIHDLADFPFLFNRPVSIVPLDDIQLNADFLGPIHALQSDLASVGVNASIAGTRASGSDLIVLGTYASPNLAAYLTPFGFNLPVPILQIPGMAPIQSAGTGLILFSLDANHSTLLILAEDASSLTSLLNVIGPQGFSDCLVQDQVAVCGIGSPTSGLDSSWWLPSPDTTPTPTPDLGAG